MYNYTQTFIYKRQGRGHLKFYSAMEIPILFYGSETWKTTCKILSKIIVDEIKFLRAVKGVREKAN